MVNLLKYLLALVLLTAGLLSASANADISPKDIELPNAITLQDSAMANQILPRAVKLSRKYKFDEAQILFEKIGRIYADNHYWLEQAYYQNMFSEHYFRMEKYKQAEELANDAVSVAKKYLGKKSESEATAYFNLGRTYLNIGHYRKAATFIQKSLAIYLTIPKLDNKLIGHCYLALGSANRKLGKYESALESYEKAMEIYRIEYGESSLAVAACLANIGSVFSYKGNWEKEKYYRELSLPIFINTRGANSPQVFITYYNIGLYHSRKGDTENALKYYKKALRGYESIGKSDISLVGTIYSSMGAIYRSRSEYQRAIETYKKAITVFDTVFGPSNYESAYCINSIGIVYKSSGDIETALNCFQEASNLLVKNTGYDPKSYAGNFLDMGDIYLQKNNYYQANLNYQKALSVYEERFSGKDQFLALIMNRFGQLNMERGYRDKALVYYQKALLANVRNFESTDISINPPLQGAISDLRLLESLTLKAEALESKSGTKKDHTNALTKAMETYELAVDLIGNIRGSFKEQDSKLLFAKEESVIFEKVIDLCLQLYSVTDDITHKEKAFYFAEKNKAGILLESLAESNARQFAGLPESLVTREKELKEDITFYIAEAAKEKEKENPDKDRIDNFENTAFSLKLEYDELLSIFEQDYPNYYNLKHDRTIASVDYIQQNLVDDESAFIEYFNGEENVQIFCITASDFNVFTIKKPENFEALLDNFRRSLSDYKLIIDSTAIADKYYSEGAWGLFDILLKPAISSFSSPVKRITFVADGKLGYINFEALITQKPEDNRNFNYQDLDFLIKDYQINYAYSAGVLKHALEKTSDNNNSQKELFAGFAPSYERLAEAVSDSGSDKMVLSLTREGNYFLPWAKDEVENIADLLNGDIYENDDATEGIFKTIAGKYRILHLAMHGLLNDKNSLYSKLLFTQDGMGGKEDNYLNVAEIFNMNISADLVVLSACNTGFGELHKGEGIMSISRAFKYAGTPSLIMTLWKLPDKEANQIMLGFYKNLVKGSTKDNALQNAKLDFLANTINPIYAHPFFWAGIVPIGNMEPIAGINENNTAFASVLPWLLIIVFGLIVYRILQFGVIRFLSRKMMPLTEVPRLDV